MDEFYNINEVSKTLDKHKLFVLYCQEGDFKICLNQTKKLPINKLDVGKEIAKFIDSLESFSYISIDVYDYFKKTVDKHKNKINNSGNDVLLIYNIGILFEPSLELNPSMLLKEVSKSISIIVLWEYQHEHPGKLHWLTKQNDYALDFMDLQIKKIQL